MKFFRKAIILFALLVIAGGAYWYFEIKKSGEKEEEEKIEALLFGQEDRDIVKLTLQREGMEPIVVEKHEIIAEEKAEEKAEAGKEEYEWMITLPVETGGDKTAVDAVVRTIKNSKREEVIWESLDKENEYGLDTPSFFIKFYYEGEETENGIAFGIESLDRKRMFAKVFGKDKIFSVPAGLKSSLNKSLFDLRDKSIASFTNEEVVEVSLLAGNEAFIMEKDEEQWYFKPDRLKASKVRVDMYTGNLRWGYFVAVEEEKGINFAKYGLDNPRMILRFKLTDGSYFMFVVGDYIKENDAEFFYATRTSDNMIFQVQAELISRLITTRFELKDRRIFNFTPDDITAVKLEKDDKSFHFIKEGDDWKLKGVEEELTRGYRIDNIVRGIAEAEYEAFDPVKRGDDRYNETGIENPVYFTALNFQDERAPLIIKMTERDEETSKIWLTPDNGETVYYTSGYFISNFPETKEELLE